MTKPLIVPLPLNERIIVLETRMPPSLTEIESLETCFQNPTNGTCVQSVEAVENQALLSYSLSQFLDSLGFTDTLKSV